MPDPEGSDEEFEYVEPEPVEGFTNFPPLYSFPPMFTLQPTPATMNQQISTWTAIIKDFCEQTNRFKLEKGHGIFSNSKIDRTASAELVDKIFEEMVRLGHADFFDNSKKDVIIVWWRSKEAWCDLLMGFVKSNGLLNSVATIFELHNDNPDMKGMDESIVVRLLQRLESSNKCALMKGADGSVEGVKFFI